MGFYEEAIADAEETIRQYGRPIKVFHPTDAPPSDPNKPWEKGQPDLPPFVATNGVFTLYERKLIDNTVIKRTDKKLIFVATGITWELSTKDYITEESGERYIICDVDLIAPGPIKVLYEVQARKG